MTDQNLAEAAEYAPIIERVHGANHPELTRVREITLEIRDSNDPQRRSVLFAELRAVTQNYAIPDDVCETFEATYKALERADRSHAAA